MLPGENIFLGSGKENPVLGRLVDSNSPSRSISSESRILRDSVTFFLNLTT